ncbi:MAG: tetratricopeptide repeat protein [Candidatus Azobacteroides sp.]|nr:tetratricopeptide repeat protein [Candidatus Azobacteroides sp.]
MMRNCKKIVIAGLALIFGTTALFAQNQKGIDYYRGNMLETAKIYFNSQLPSLGDADKAEAYYYLGLIYLDQNNKDSASYAFNKSAEINPDYPFAYVGQGALALKNNNKKEAEDLFSRATKIDKKNSNILVDIALAYGKSNMFSEAASQIEKARKMDKNNPRIYVAEGDLTLMEDPTKAGEAAAKYENAIYFDSNWKEAYLKRSRVYRTINIDVSLDLVTKVIEMDPDYIPAYLELGETYYANGLYTKSAQAYKRYMEAPGVPESYQEKYAAALFVAKDFQGVLNQVNETLKKNPQNVHMLRLKMFAQYELKDYSGALQTANQFFNMVGNDAAWQDYRYYALILKENNQPEASLNALNKALETEKNQPELYKELAMAYDYQEDYKNALANYQKYLEISPAYSLSDLLTIGRTYYAYGSDLPDSEEVEKREAFHKADSLFTEITVKAPQLYQGYWWKARTVHKSQDPETKQGLAKPYYEQTLEQLLQGDNPPASVQIEVYQYLAYYYYLRYDEAVRANNRSEINENKALSIENWEKVLSLDPGNEGAIQALKVLR